MLFSKATEEYIRHIKVEKGFSATTISNYQNRLRYLGKWMVANGYPAPTIHDITTPMLRRFLENIVEQGQRPRTIKGKFAAIKGVCRFLMKETLLTVNPCDALTLPKLDAPIRLLMADEQISLMFEAAYRIKSPRRQAMARAVLSILNYAGLRRAECRDLTPQDIDLEDKSVLVRSGKGSKSRRIFLPDTAVGYLREWIALRGDCNHNFLFGSAERRMHDDGLMNIIEELKRLSGQAGNDAIKPHSIRHAYATRLLRNGANLVDISATLGHTGENALRTTTIYLSTNEEQLRGIANLAEIQSTTPQTPAPTVKDVTLPDSLEDKRRKQEWRVRTIRRS